MRILIRAALMAMSLASITPVANAASVRDTPAIMQQDSTAGWANG